MDASWLAGPEGRAAVTDAQALTSGDPLADAATLRRRHPELTPAQTSDALGQAELRRLAADRYGISEPLLWTRDGLEQATRPEVAAHRAAQFVAAGARRVIDLTAGLGSDTRAMLAAGLQVTAIERDPGIAELLRANAPQADVICADAIDIVGGLVRALTPHDVVFVDPARRSPDAPRQATGRANPERDPERWSPRWSQIEAMAHPRIAAKTAPGFDPPAGWTAEWVSVHRTVVECFTTSWPIGSGRSRATVIADSGVHTLVADGASDEITPVGAWLFEPDPAVIRAQAVDALRPHGLGRIDTAGVWLTSDRPAPASAVPFVRGFRIVTELTGSTVQLRRQLDELGIDRLTVKSRDVRIAPEVALRELRRREGDGHVLILARVNGRTGRWIATPD